MWQQNPNHPDAGNFNLPGLGRLPVKRPGSAAPEEQWGEAAQPPQKLPRPGQPTANAGAPAGWQYAPQAAQGGVQPAGFQQQVGQQQQQQAQQQPQQPPAQIQPVAAAAAGGTAKGDGKGKVGEQEVFIVTATGAEAKEVVVRTLVGEYVEKGVNHGRKVYQKVSANQGFESVTCLMYYWDSRDGPGFEGWWFGNKLGGTQVWSHCKDSALQPPKTGWKIPWDGEVRPGLIVISKVAQQREAAAAKLKELSEEIVRVDTDVAAALENASSPQGLEELSLEALTEAEQTLAPQVPVVDSFVEKVSAAAKGAVADTVQPFKSLADRAKYMQDTLRKRHGEVSERRKKLETEKAEAEREEKDTIVLDEVLQGATEKLNSAEDMVEKTVITSEMVWACCNDEDIVNNAMADTEVCAKQAQAAIGEARIYLNAKHAQIKRLGDRTREKGAAELSKLQQQLGDAQQKLAPLKNIRKEVEAKRAAIKLVEEINEKLALAEVDVDRADEMVSLLNSGPVSKDCLQQAQQQVATAEQHVNQAMRLYESKTQGKGDLSEELKSLGPRGEAARSRLVQLKTSIKEAGERATMDGYCQEATEKVLSVMETLGKLEVLDARRKDGEDVTPEEVQSSEAAAAQVQTAASMARMFIQMKALEVKRFSTATGKEASEKFAEFQKQIETATKRLAEIKRALAQGKRVALVREIDSQVVWAEGLVSKVKDSASIFADDAKLAELSVEELRSASEQTLAAEKEANEALMEVRKKATARQIESKGKDASAEISGELIKFQTRLSAAQAELTRQRKLFASVESRLAARRCLDEAEKKFEGVEQKLQTLENAVAKLSKDGATTAGTESKEADSAAQEAQLALRTLSRYVETQARTAKDALQKLEPRTKALNDRLQAALATKKERQEGLVVNVMLSEGQQKVAACEEQLRLAVEAESPFQDEAQSAGLSKAQAAAKVAELEKAISAAQSKTAEAKTFVSMKRLAVRGLSETSSKTVLEALGSMQAAVDNVMGQLQEMRRRIMDIKKANARRK